MKDLQLSDFLKLKRPMFTGETMGEDPLWFLEGMEKSCKALGCPSTQQVDFTAYQLQGKADNLWNNWDKGRSSNSPTVEWEEFKKVFMELCITYSVILAKAREFDTLKKGSMTIEEYDTEFN